MCSELGHKLEVVSTALEGTAVRRLQLSGYNNNEIGDSLYKTFVLLKHTAIEELDFTSPYMDEEDASLNDWNPDSIRRVFFKLNGTKVRKVKFDKEYYPGLVDAFNTKVAYPNDTICYENGLQRVCMRTIIQSMPDPKHIQKLPVPNRLKEAIKTYAADMPGLYIRIRRK
ncbi:hypothetical protein [Candidatus Cardinium hertigii]|uniref:SOCS box domain-containing protein n=1 Tax=Candidatus Cardinium hertigii TaxID=247481 RepID=A0A3N2QCF2_9BACT|nr:hypothetical protein [Candidatus Cardinium hertigii]ROT47493.1 hypothetical protein EDM02_02465 [Candidatus Cardinium hertigii]